MRAMPLSLTGCVVLFLAGSVSAQVVQFQAVVSQPTADVLCRPGSGPEIYVTNHLQLGDVVHVVQDMGNGWLEILPPPGSFSWINKRDLEPNPFPNSPDRIVVWTGSNTVKASVFVGSEFMAGSRRVVVGAQLPPGSQQNRVARIAPVKDNDGEWIAIEAPLGELRYLRAEKVTRSASGGVLVARGAGSQAPNLLREYPATGSQTSSFTPSSGQPSGQPQVTGTLTARVPLTEAEQLWQRAQQAERSGNVNEAIQLYSELAAQTSGSNHDLAMQGLNRAYWLRESRRNSVTPTIPPVQARPVQPSTGSEVRYGTGPNPAVAVQPSAPPGPTSTASAPWQPATPEGYRSSGPGRLRRAGRCVENHKTYVLESLQNYPMLYVTPQNNLDLEPFLDHNVELYGPAIYRGDLRANYMTVVRVQPLP